MTAFGFPIETTGEYVRRTKSQLVRFLQVFSQSCLVKEESSKDDQLFISLNLTYILYQIFFKKSN